MRDLTQQEINAIVGGNPVFVLVGATWGVASVGWQFYQGYRDGYRLAMQ